MPDFQVKLIESFEIDSFCNLLLEMRPVIAGLTNRRIYKSIGKEAMNNDNLIIVIAKDNQKIVGFTITVIDWKNFWLKFLLLNPIVSAEIISNKIINKLISYKIRQFHKNNEEEITSAIAIDQTNKSWNDSAPNIAKVVYTGVDEDYRGKGIATAIGNYRFKILTAKRVIRIDSNLDPKNIAAIKLNRKLGYKIFRTKNRLFLSKDL